MPLTDALEEEAGSQFSFKTLTTAKCLRCFYDFFIRLWSFDRTAGLYKSHGPMSGKTHFWPWTTRKFPELSPGQPAFTEILVPEITNFKTSGMSKKMKIRYYLKISAYKTVVCVFLHVFYYRKPRLVNPLIGNLPDVAK